MTSRKAWTPALIFLWASAALILPAGAAAGAGGVSLLSKVGGMTVAGSKDSRPVALSARATDVDLVVTNHGSTTIVARTVRLSSSVLGLNFFAYETAVQIRVEPGATENRRFTLDLSALKGQASGLLPASISLLDARRNQLASQSAIVDVHGSKRSVYGIFGLILFVLSGLALIQALLGLVRHHLSPNRWWRGVRFLVPGIGFGLALVIGFSVFSVFSPRLSRWGPIVLISALGLFAVGYFSPTPESDEQWPPDDQAEEAQASAPPPPPLANVTVPSSAPSTLPHRPPAPSTLPPGAFP